MIERAAIVLSVVSTLVSFASMGSAQSSIVIEINKDDVSVLHGPFRTAKRRGALVKGTRLQTVGLSKGGGCPAGRWFELSVGGFVCASDARVSALPPWGRPQPDHDDRQLLPHDYAFVVHDGARAFAHPSDYLVDDYVEALGKGFGVVVVKRVLYEGERFAKTKRNLWILEDDLRFAKPSSFTGVHVVGGDLAFGWIVAEGADLRARPRGKRIRRAKGREQVAIERAENGWSKLKAGGWLRDAELVRPRQRARPSGVEAEDRWIDVDTEKQVLVAYRGDVAVFATLISSGRSGRNHETPKGLFRIWAKLAYSDMNDTERDDVSQNYSLRDVPWVQYFEGDNGFHAVFWHDDFGRRHSRGCINLSPRDAKFLFDFTRPPLPPGWRAIVPNAGEDATWVQIR